jgi:hypothetical protein
MTMFDAHKARCSPDGEEIAGHKFRIPRPKSRTVVSLLDHMVAPLMNGEGRLPVAAHRAEVSAAGHRLKKHTEDFFKAANPHRARQVAPGKDIGDHIWVQRGAAGLGKTSVYVDVARSYARDRNLRILILLPDHGMVAQVAARIPEAIVLKGRDRPGQCLRPKLLHKAAALQLPIEETLCKGCPERRRCPYQVTIAKVAGPMPTGPLSEALPQRTGCIVLATHEQLIYYRPRFGFHVVIVDESCLKVFQKVVTLHPDRFEAAMKRDPSLAPALGLILAAVRVEDGKILTALRGIGFAKAEPINRIATRVEVMAAAERPVMDLTRADDDLLGELDQSMPGEFGKLAALLRQLGREIDLPRDTANGVVYQDKRVSVDGVAETQERIDVCGLHPLGVPSSVPILITDASADETLLRRIWPRLSFTGIAAPRNAVFIQSTSAKFDCRALESGEENAQVSADKSEGYLRQVAKFVKSLGAECPLLVTYKKIATLLKSSTSGVVLPPNCKVAHFGALRGRNDWENCDAVVVMGRQQPRPVEIEKNVRCFWNDDPRPIAPQAPTSKMVSLRGAEVGIEVEAYADPRFQAVLRQIREEDIGQALDRLRLVHAKFPKLVVLLNRVDLGLPIDLALPWPELRGRALRVLAALSATTVIRKNSRYTLKDLKAGHGWKTSKQFWRDVSVLQKRMGPVEASAFDKLFPSFHLYSYRLEVDGKRQAGKCSEAWVHDTVRDPAAAIEARHGAEGKVVRVLPA